MFTSVEQAFLKQFEREARETPHFANNRMSQGAALIDGAGVVTLRCLEA